MLLQEETSYVTIAIVEDAETTKSSKDEETSKYIAPDENAPSPDLASSPDILEELEKISAEETVLETSVDVAEVTEFKLVEKEQSPLIEEVEPIYPQIPKVQEVIVPVVVKTLEVTKAPEVVKTPEVTKAPEVTKVPEVIKTLETNRGPEVIKAPVVIKASEVIKAPEVTKAPVKIRTPGLTKTPELVKPPEVTRTPEVTKTSEVVKLPEVVVKAPEVINIPQTSKTPEVIKLLEAIKAPEVIKVRDIASFIEPPKQKVPRVQEQLPMALDLPKEQLGHKIQKKERELGQKVVSTDVEMLEVGPVEEKKLMLVAVDKLKFEEKVTLKEKTMPINGDIIKVFTFTILYTPRHFKPQTIFKLKIIILDHCCNKYFLF